MAARKPLVIVSGQVEQIQSGDTIDGSFQTYGTAANTAAQGNDSRFTQISASQQSGAYTFVPGDAGTCVECTAAGATNFTIDTNANQAIPVNSVIEVFQDGAGQVTIVAAGGVTLRSDGSKVKTAAQYATIRLRQRATNEWVLAGDLA